MLHNKKWKFEPKMSVVANSFNSEQNLHEFGIRYISNFLNRFGFAILKVNSDPNHPSQILASLHDRSLLIAVRTACHPDIGKIDSQALELLVRESEELDVKPYFTGLSIIPKATNNVERDSSRHDQEYTVIFNGIIAVSKSQLLVANG